MINKGQVVSRVQNNNPLWVSEDGWYQPHDFWLSLCGLYEHYAYALILFGDLRGKKILDCGCGQGHTSVMLAKHGALVTAFDASAKDIEAARKIASANNVEIEFRTLRIEKLDFPDEHFDYAFGACVLHHVDKKSAASELRRVLRPGGQAVFIENSARNPILMGGRKHLVGSFNIPRYGDDDEYPLLPQDFIDLESCFPGHLQIHYPNFLFWRLLDFYILRKRFSLMTLVLRSMDNFMGKVPVLREYGYFLIVQLDKE